MSKKHAPCVPSNGMGPDVNHNKNSSHSTGESHSPSAAFLRTDGGRTKSNAIEIPSIALPKGGGAIKSISEKFSVNPVNGTAAFSIPIPFSPIRGFSPVLNLSYSSGGGNGIFGLGWGVRLPSIKRRTDKGLPIYQDATDADTFLLTDAEDLVPEFQKEPDESLSTDINGDYIVHEKPSADGLFTIRFYVPRIEGLYARIERWTRLLSGEIKWRVITKENVTTLFGWSAAARIADPADPVRVFEWLPEFIYDELGNCCHYIYKPEDDEGFNASFLHNRNRVKAGNLTYTNLYPEKILHGNKTPYTSFGDAFPAEADYLFSTMFDYGTPIVGDTVDTINTWDFRTDAFSDYKAGFEIRTTRLCKRVLLFHRFQANEYNGLVKSLDFGYDTVSERDFTFLKSIIVVGYIKKPGGDYTVKKLPPFEFNYQKHDWNQDVKTIAPAELVHMPAALDEKQYQFTDLYNEGLSGILTEQANGWYYKHNLGDGKFEQARLITPKPSFLGLGGQFHLADLNADGGKQLISFDNDPKGYFELDDDNEWQAFRAFQQLPNVSHTDPFTKMLDLNGDGKPEILISDDNFFTWYPSEGRSGFAPAQKTVKPYDEEEGPALDFADEKQSIFLASMSGSGLMDLVRIRNGEVCYWPNLGHGKFGAKIGMDNAPLFDHPDSFNPAYIKLADIDGSGTTDIIYLGKNKFSCWTNLSGNSFNTTPFEIESVPGIDNQSTITVTDLLGNGVACIVWSSNLAKDLGAQLRYIDLMNSKKPHIMVSYKNNLGKEVSLEYVASTKFYVADKLAGNPWITKLHFPVHCVSSIDTYDAIAGHHLTTIYKYHHGYYDHPEREFRGFGMVEQIDAENFEDWAKGLGDNVVDDTLHQEPVVIRSWYHTGAFLRSEKILHQFEHEYWYNEMSRQGFPVVHSEVLLPEARLIPVPGLPPAIIGSLSAQEWQEAVRACKGMPLRSEIFARDAAKHGNGPAAKKKELTPFTVADHNCVIELVQPKGKNKYAVFAVKESESITYTYERDTTDPRIAHTLNIELDKYGNVLESASVMYPRVVVDATLPLETRNDQAKTCITYNKNRYTNDVLGDNMHRLRLLAEAQTFELKNVSKTSTYYKLADFTGILTNALSDTAFYHELNKPTGALAQRRLVEHSRSTFYNANLQTELPLLQLQLPALTFQSYQLAYTPELLTDIFSAKVPTAAALNAIMVEAKFTHCLDENNIADNNWWIPSGSQQYIQGAETAANAKQRFYVSLSYTDPYQAKTKLSYYSNYFFLINETEDALGNKTKVDKFNFRTLAPQRVRDINNNLSASLVDELGFVKALAVMGKDTNNDGVGEEADDLIGLNEFTDAAENILTADFFSAPDSTQLTNAGKSLLQHATTRFVYDFEVYKNTGRPAAVATISREEHFQKNNNSPVQLSFEYTDGHGRVAMKKMQAEPGMAKKTVVNPDDSFTIVDVNTAPFLRWIGSGKTIYNNKGNPVKRYEPYFSVTQQFEDLKELVETGVTPIMFYDAMERVIKTKMPNGTFSSREFYSWRQVTSDANDNTLEPECTWYINRHNRLIDALLIAEGKDPAKEESAANKAALHAGTPTVVHLDTLARAVLSVDHNKNLTTNADEFSNTIINLDIEGNLRTVTDDRGNPVMQYKYDMLGDVVYHKSMDAGQRWLLANIMRNQLYAWDERAHEFHYTYDIFHRPVSAHVKDGDGLVPLDNIFDRIIYGEDLLLPGRANEAALQALNILGEVIQHFDTGGLVDTPAYDFKNDPISTSRKLFRKYKEAPNWTDANLAPDLENDVFTFITETDALDRITRQIAPDGSIITPSYNETGLLNSEVVAHVNPAANATYIKDIDYNEKGQRNKIIYGNDVITRFYYDTETFHLKRLETKRQNNDRLQDWRYTFDAVGNITHIEDRDVPETFFDNNKVTGVSEYTYDALYRLREATGRENTAALNFGDCDNWNDKPRIQQVNTGGSMAVFGYTQFYKYDSVGNIKEMKHVAPGRSWTRTYDYELLNNRLISTHIGDNGAPADYLQYTHHAAHGFLVELPHLEKIGWNFKEEIMMTTRQHCTDDNIPVTTYYQYDSNGDRIRKITENFSAGGNPTKKDERIYVSGFETYRAYQANVINFERESLSLIDKGNRFVMVETVKTSTIVNPDPADVQGSRLVRYQLHNHLGSAAMELDGSPQANVLSYEEYHPFGTTAYQAYTAAIRTAAKRYRYTGMERDEETGLEYHSARYYLPWLGRWCNADPIGIDDGVNVYAYLTLNPISFHDPTGTQGDPPAKKKPAGGAAPAKPPSKKKTTAPAKPAAKKPAAKKPAAKKDPAPAKPPAKKATPPPPPANGKILIVMHNDTKPASQNEVAQNEAAAKKAGYTIIKATSGEDLLKKLDKSKVGTIKELTILSHGVPTGLGGEAPLSGLYLGENKAGHDGDQKAAASAATIGDLKKKIDAGDIVFDKDAQIILGGCRTASTDEDKDIEAKDTVAAKIAVTTNRTVIASTGKTFFGGEKGETPNRTSGGHWVKITPAKDGEVKTEKRTKVENVVP